MSGAGMLLLFLVAAGADDIASRFGLAALYLAVGICCAMLVYGEVKTR